MDSKHVRSSNEDGNLPRASRELLVAALSGLLSLTAFPACSEGPANPAQGQRPTGNSDASGNADSASPETDADTSPDGESEASDAGDDGTYNRAILVDANLSLADFQAMCEARGGFLYVNASCAGGAACAGLSYHDGTLWDHSCRGQNSTCAGWDCVNTPADRGLTGKDIYEQGPCGGCHGLYDAKTMKSDYSKYAIYYDPQDTSYPVALATFQNSTPQRLSSQIAFGISGVHDDGTPYNNMPAYYQKYSAAEIGRVAAYIKMLNPFAYAYTEYGPCSTPTACADAGPRDGGSSDAGVQDGGQDGGGD